MRKLVILLALLVSGLSAAQSGLQITQMPQAVLPLTGNEIVTLVQPGFSISTCPLVGNTGLCNTQTLLSNVIGTLTNVNIVNGNLGKPSFIDLTNAINAPATSFPACGPFSVVSNNLSSSSTPQCNNTLSIASIVVPNGATITTTGSGTNTANALLAGTSLAGTTGLDLTSAPGSSILPIANGGNGTATPVISAGTNITVTGTWPNYTITASSTAATAFSAITGATNVSAAMIVGTGASLAASGSGTITATAMPFSGLSSATNTTGALVVGTGGSLAATGSGTIVATSSATASSASTASTLTAGVISLNAASASNFSILAGASSGVLHLNDGTGTGQSNLGNVAGTTEIDGAPVNLNPAKSGNVGILTGASSGVVHLDDGSGTGAIHIGDGTGTSAITIGNTTGPTTTALNGTLTQTGIVNANVAGANAVNILTGASSAAVHINDGSGTGQTNLGNAAGTTVIGGGPVNVNPGASAGNVNILSATTATGATHIGDGAGGTGGIFIGNSSDALTLSSATIKLNGNNPWVSTTAPTIGAGFGSTASFSPAFSTTKAFIIVASGTGQSSTTALTAFATAQNNWICTAQDKTTALTARQSVSTTTAVTITWSSAPTANDVLLFQCDAI